MQIQKNGLSDICKTSNKLKNTWRLWAKSLGEKASKCDNESDKIAVIRTIIFATYLITNCFIIAGVIRHWNDSQEIIIQIDGVNYGKKVLR